MSIGLAFYVLMLIWLVWGFWGTWATPNPPWPLLGGNLLLFILLLLLGWHDFGPPIHG
jgi:O-antigen ligase